MSDTLAHRLWAGTLDDPTAPGRDLARRIAGGSGYPQALADLRVLARHGLHHDLLILRSPGDG